MSREPVVSCYIAPGSVLCKRRVEVGDGRNKVLGKQGEPAAGASSAVFRSLLLVSPPGLSRVQTEDIAHRGRITSD